MYDTTIFIPYRNRRAHLDYWLTHTAPLLYPNTRIVIVEQAGNKAFNRGKLLNVGFARYTSDTKYIMTHDVDINPNVKALSEFYNQSVADNEVLGIYTSYCETLGGIVKLTPNTINLINGFPNDYWGWGCEDRALYNRCLHYNIKIKKNILNNMPSRTDYFTIFNDVDDRVLLDLNTRTQYEYHEFLKLDASIQRKRIQGSGLSTLKYKLVNNLVISPNIMHIFVDID
jgi:hypothetical protein